MTCGYSLGSSVLIYLICSRDLPVPIHFKIEHSSSLDIIQSRYFPFLERLQKMIFLLTNKFPNPENRTIIATSQDYFDEIKKASSTSIWGVV